MADTTSPASSSWNTAIERAEEEVAFPSEFEPVPAVSEAPRLRKRLGWGFWIPAAWVVLVILAAALANILPIPDPTAINSLPKLGPSSQHLLGTDDIGRDMLSRLVFGARVSLEVGFASIALGLFFGGMFGMIAGFFGGGVDTFMSSIVNIGLAFPPLVLALAVISFVGPGLVIVIVVIGVLSVPPITRLVRASTITYAQRDFVLSARALGATRRRILVREILPNVIPAALAFSLVAVALAIVAEGTLAFLGLSVPPPTPTWGGMINEGRNLLQTDPWISMLPALALFLTALVLNLAGDRLRGYFDVREGAI